MRLAVAAAPTTMLRDDRSDIYIVDIASRAADKITTNAGPDTVPRWSPDGRTIAFTSETNRNPEWPDGTRSASVVNAHLTLYDVASRTLRDASTPQFDLLAGDPVWTPDSRQILFTTGKSVYRDVFAYDVAGGRYEQVTKNQIVTLGTLSRDGSRAALLLESATAAADIYVSDLAMTSPQRLTTINPEASEFALGEAEVIRWKSDGFEIEGILQKPVGYASGTRYPLLVVPHGGPTGAYLNSFRVGFGDGGQHWAGQGWAVLYPNPRGSTNYGERFMTANLGDWGGGDFRDVMAGVDAVVARGLADPNRLAIEGWSYGGYMTAWAITQTNRFKAAMVGAGIINLVSMYATNDLPNVLAGFFRGVPGAANLSLYLERSPLSYAAKLATPTLILHGGSDERVPIGQPMELYRALRDRGVAAELVFYPREGHGLTEYFHQLDRLRRQFDWITKHVERRRPTSP
jgi:dipeptidyl aminopeptidase/acylaminoacyl peptidase